MTIQELRERTAKKLAEIEGFTWDWVIGYKFEDEWFGKADQILSLDGLLIEVEGELPEKTCDEIDEIFDRWTLRPNYARELVQIELDKAGYKKVSPTKDLLKEVSNEKEV